MKPFTPPLVRIGRWLLLAGFVSSTGLRANLLDTLLPRDELQAITVTDFTEAGRQHRLPTPQAPVRYLAVSAGYHDFGGIMAGDRPISRELVNQTVVKVLAKQGYLPVGPDQKPDITLLWTWGTLYVERLHTGNTTYSPQINQNQMLRFLGGAKVGLQSEINNSFPELSMDNDVLLRSGPASDLIEVAQNNLFVVAISAYETKLGPDHRSVLLWNTRISCPSRGYWLTEALPSMVVMAGPCIGRETDKPVWVKATDRFKPEVKLRDLKILDYLQSGAAGVVNSGDSQ